jgi:hypothetical protein
MNKCKTEMCLKKVNEREEYYYVLGHILVCSLVSSTLQGKVLSLTPGTKSARLQAASWDLEDRGSTFLQNVGHHHTTRRHIRERVLFSHHCENLKSNNMNRCSYILNDMKNIHIKDKPCLTTIPLNEFYLCIHLLNKLLQDLELWQQLKHIKYSRAINRVRWLKITGVSRIIPVPIIRVWCDIRVKLSHLYTSPWPVIGTRRKQLGC